MKETDIPPHAVDDPKPKVRKAVRVWLADGTKMLAMWTGQRWWSTKGAITPARWELEERKKKTKKLRKALRCSEGGEA
jgi:hypothetical protein